LKSIRYRIEGIAGEKFKAFSPRRQMSFILYEFTKYFRIPEDTVYNYRAVKSGFLNLKTN
jgi:hypothetical protein